MTTPLDPVTVTVLGVLIAVLFPTIGLLFAILALLQGNLNAAIVFGIIWLMFGTEPARNRDES